MSGHSHFAGIKQKKALQDTKLRVLGIDPGTATTGWAVIEEKNKNPRLIACGCINTSKINSDAERLVEIGRDISSLIKKHKPAEAAIEDLFFFKNLKTAITVAQARGVILYEIKKDKVPLSSLYSPPSEASPHWIWPRRKKTNSDDGEKYFETKMHSQAR